MSKPPKSASTKPQKKPAAPAATPTTPRLVRCIVPGTGGLVRVTLETTP